MTKIVCKVLIGGMIILFHLADVQAQYTVFNVKGTVEMSVDGQNWNPLKKKDGLKASHQVRLLERSFVEIIDSQNLVYGYDVTGVIRVSDIVKQRKTVLEAMNEKSGSRAAIGGVVRGDQKEAVCYILFTVLEPFNLYDNYDLIPEGAVFYMTVYNETANDLIVNVSQELENKELIQCFPENLHVEKNSFVEIKDLFFGKQEKNRFTISYVKEEE